MPVLRTIFLTSLAMLAFAGNSLLCRAALKHTAIDAGSFTLLRLAAGALVLCWVTRWRSGLPAGRGSWLSAVALFGYAAAFSYAYVNLSAATGALLLFGAVQITMIGRGLWAGERLSVRQTLGLVLALAGLLGLLLPGVSSPPVGGTLMMLAAGVAWGVYSLRGRATGDPTRVSAGNFVRAVPIAAALQLVALSFGARASFDVAGVGDAVLSGALASGVGYAIWYAALPRLQATQAATVQLSVPVIAAAGGVVFLGEALTWRLVLASTAVLGGIALVILQKRPAKPG